MYMSKLNTAKITQVFIDKDLENVYFQYWGVPEVEKYHLEKFIGIQNT